MRILYLTFYFEPDLCAGSFRNTPLAKELAKQFIKEGEIDVISTLPNRYISYQSQALPFERVENLNIRRIVVPSHKGDFIGQMNSFKRYFTEVKKIVAGQNYNLVFASSSRLFTAYLGYSVAKKKGIPLYLDIRDLFVDTMRDIMRNPIFRSILLPILKKVEYKTFSYATHINLISEGFKGYFYKYPQANYSFFSNGIDEEFLALPPSKLTQRKEKIILYAGNIGEGQGLHKIIPYAAKRLGENYLFIIIGDGGAKNKLLSELKALGVENVQLMDPLPRLKLQEKYADADFLMLHLNEYDALKKVLPSKIFELASYDKPIIAGVSGFSREFIIKNIPNHILFSPGDVTSFVDQLLKYKYKSEFRRTFIKQFGRDFINKNMSKSILSYIL